MTTSNSCWRALLISICLLIAGRTQASTFETVESTDLGDGWFQYDVKIYDDPFFRVVALMQFEITITNGVDVQYGADPANWSSTTNTAIWKYSGTYPQSRPNEQIFLLHSSATNHMLGTATSVVSMFTSDVYPYGFVD